ncbi:ribosomal protein S18 acetylase RimI-like enzyme [Friedmanniella endophytica]|uniref:Ribosomal protein S18 acetylase RimI-like enzyme n=1 Tax=Microlunatus kandeliicorticis TaxID=1759536 RepID=A0A7W3P6Y7_9ACTN|nr:GNAT family N-acetyltransferase [Microlunatus kandeliicorticis]MBA8795464.1 ribosomal protein S18 acetylase RimI-like enzyme [Microlunatus kandeliicorticis]
MTEVPLPLTVRDLTADDLPVCGWAGSGVPRGLDRAARGEADYLVVCGPSGLPLATGGVDWTKHPDAGELYQLHVHELVRSAGVGTVLIAALEQRIRDRGRDRAELGVDVQEPRPQRLYERLGYTAYGSEQVGWDQLQPDGSHRPYTTTATLLRKPLR